MRVSHETIYQSLFVQGKGELRRELARCLRSGRTSRRKHGYVEKRGQISGMVMIADRPAEADDRAVPDTGRETSSWARTAEVPSGPSWSARRGSAPPAPQGGPFGQAVDTAMRKAVTTLPTELCRSITWDQGKETSCHADFTLATDIPIYFCDPRSPWERGSNENTNGLLRQYCPKAATSPKSVQPSFAPFSAASTDALARRSDS